MQLEQIFAEIDREEADRRSSARYPLELRLQFRGLGRGNACTGVGRTMNISSQGILVRPASDAAVALGSKLETVLEWPALLDGAVRLQLVVIGRVVRQDLHGFAVEFKRHDFRTTRKRSRSAKDRLALDSFQRLKRFTTYSG